MNGLKGKDSANPTQRKGRTLGGGRANRGADAIFSLDSVITAVGMVDHRAVMMAAVIIAISLMLLASKSLDLICEQPSHHCVILCL